MNNVTITNIRATSVATARILRTSLRGMPLSVRTCVVFQRLGTWLGPPWKQTSRRHVNFSGKINTRSSVPRGTLRVLLSRVSNTRTNTGGDRRYIRATPLSKGSFYDATTRTRRVVWDDNDDVGGKNVRAEEQSCDIRSRAHPTLPAGCHNTRNARGRAGYHGDVRLFTGAGEVSKYSLYKYIHISLFSIQIELIHIFQSFLPYWFCITCLWVE